MMGGMLAAGMWILIMFGFMLWFIRSEVMTTLYAALGVRTRAV